MQTTQLFGRFSCNTCTTDSYQNNDNAGRSPCEIYTRVMGYYRPVSFFNNGKKSEYYSRTYFTQGKSLNSQFCKDFS